MHLRSRLTFHNVSINWKQKRPYHAAVCQLSQKSAGAHLLASGSVKIMRNGDKSGHKTNHMFLYICTQVSRTF